MSGHSAGKREDAREFIFTKKDFDYIAKLVHKRTGIVLAEHKKDMAYARLSRRLRALNMRSFDQYYRFLETRDGDKEMGNLVNAITTNLTSFFREAHHFEHLKNDVILPLLKTSTNKRLRIWSAGCSSGAEPYSIAMVLASALENFRGWDAKILATDIDTNMLERGRNGKYRAADYENIPKAYRKYVKKTEREGEDGIIMDPRLKQLISFKPLNLLEGWPMKGPFDVIFCRNVVIYFDKETQSVLFNRYADMLKPDGWLYIGHSENLFKVCDRFSLHGKTVYQRSR